MRIIVSGTHASGKSTLISDFRVAHPEYLALPDPFDDLDFDDPASERSFAAQLRSTASRLAETAHETDVIAERGPLDFLAYLTALTRLGRSDGSLLARASAIAEASMAQVELIAVVPLDGTRRIRVPDDEDPALRVAMDEALLELLDDLESDGMAPPIITIAGDPEARLELLEHAALR